MHPDMEKYKSVSGQLHEIWRSYATELEAVAFDEAYLDVKEKAKDIEGARRIAREIKQRTLDELRLTCSVGLAYSKTAAKTASEEKKPDGYFEILTPEDFVNLVIDRDVRALYTVGAMTAEKLYSYGIHTVRDIRDKQDIVVNILGKQGRWISQLARGIDNRKVTPYKPEDAKSISREVTFQEDVTNFELLKDVLVHISLCVKRRADRYGLHGNGVTLKITYSDMKGITRSRLVPYCDTAEKIYRNAAELLDGIERRPVRLVGAGVYNLSGEEDQQLSMEDLAGGGDETDMETLLERLGLRYGLDFAGNLDKIYKADTLHRTVEYMRKHI